MGKSNVRYVTDADNIGRFEGEQDGYSYKMRQYEDGEFAYTIESPTGEAKYVECNVDGADELVESPKDFWEKYCT